MTCRVTQAIKQAVKQVACLIACVTPQIVSTSFQLITAINAPQKLGILLQVISMVRSSDPFFRHHKEKWKKVVWLCETRYYSNQGLFSFSCCNYNYTNFVHVE